MKKIIAFFMAISLSSGAFAGLPFVGKRDVEIPSGGSHPPVFTINIKANGNTKITSMDCDMRAGGSGCHTQNLYQGKFKNPITFKQEGSLYQLKFNKNHTVTYSEYDSSLKKFSAENCPDGACIAPLQ